MTTSGDLNKQLLENPNFQNGDGHSHFEKQCDNKSNRLNKVNSHSIEMQVCQADVSGKGLTMSEKLQDFVEESQGSQIPPRLSSVNLHRLSQFQSNLILSNNQSKIHKQRQSVFLASGLNFNYEDILDDVVEIDNGKLIVQHGDNVKRYTIGPQMMQYLGKDIEKQVSEISKPLYTRIHPYLAWFLVFYATINGACIPPWIMSIPAEKYLRISWRFFMQAIMMIPFLIYEKRNLPLDQKYQYTLGHIFNLEHIKKVYLVAFTNSIWFTMVLFAFEWNFISHALVLSGLQQFIFSIQRHIKKEGNHDYENAGQAMVIVGVLCVLTDTITYNPDEAPPSTKDYRNQLVQFRKPWQRLVIGNFTALLVSFLMFRMSRHQGEARKFYPQFLSMALVFAFTSVNMTMSSYFFAGSDLVHDSFWGWLGLFSSQQFSGFLFMSITLGMGNFVTQVLINKLFEPIIPATVALFEPIFSTIILQIVGVQIIPRGLACLGYVFILPGLFVIVLGQHLLGIKRKQEEEEKFQQQVQEEIKRLEGLQTEQLDNSMSVHSSRKLSDHKNDKKQN